MLHHFLGVPLQFVKLTQKRLDNITIFALLVLYIELKRNRSIQIYHQIYTTTIPMNKINMQILLHHYSKMFNWMIVIKIIFLHQINTILPYNQKYQHLSSLINNTILMSTWLTKIINKLHLRPTQTELFYCSMLMNISL
jgi:hypothetical protein